MLDSESLLVVENRVVQDLEDRRSAFDREVGQLWENMSAKGMLLSTMTVAQTLESIGNEFRVRVSLIWHAFARAFDAKKIVISEKVASEVKQRLADLLEQCSADLPAQYKKAVELMQAAGSFKSLQELRTAALERIATEIDYAVLKHSASADHTASVFNIYQSYGIVQTGAGASASLAINLGGEERREIETALKAIEQALDQASSLSSVERSQSLELVSDIQRELQRKEPNRFRIRGAMEGLATTIQTISATPQAYQLLKGAAALLGLQLP
jgi:hypothetical protein